MESRIKGYKLVPELQVIENCEGCVFNDKNKEGCEVLAKNYDCLKYKAIYVPSDTSIEVPKQQEKHGRQTK